MVPGEAVQTVAEGSTVTQPDDPVLPGSYFGGWYTDTSYTTKWLFGVTTVNSGLTLHAKWLTETEANTLDFGGGIMPTEITVSNEPGESWTDALSEISGGGNNKNYVITVAGDIEGIAGSTTANFGSVTGIKVSLRGTGSLALGSTNGSLITVGANQTLILRGPTLRGKTGNDKAVVIIEGSGTKFIMNSGVIWDNRNNTNGDSGGVRVRNKAEFTMYGGTIRDNTGVNGGGVRVRDATFTMEGGTISGNSASNTGGGVNINEDGTFIMNGGTISDNIVEYTGGGVVAESNGSFFTMNGGTISRNTARNGGGVGMVEEGSFTMNNGTISGNTARYGGGVDTDSDEAFTMSGGTISGNTARYGGGVLVGSNADFAMSGGTISGNTANYDGGGVAVAGGDFSKNGGTIYGGTAGGNSNRAQADGKGHAVAVVDAPGEDPAPEDVTVLYYRDTTSGPGHTITTSSDISD
jgi:hypothetical protein